MTGDGAEGVGAGDDGGGGTSGAGLMEEFGGGDNLDGGRGGEVIDEKLEAEGSEYEDLFVAGAESDVGERWPGAGAGRGWVPNRGA